MEVEDARLGTSVQVQVDYRKPQRQGSVGTIRKRYGTDHYTALEVLFPMGSQSYSGTTSWKKHKSRPLGQRGGAGSSGSCTL